MDDLDPDRCLDDALEAMIAPQDPAVALAKLEALAASIRAGGALPRVSATRPHRPARAFCVRRPL